MSLLRSIITSFALAVGFSQILPAQNTYRDIPLDCGGWMSGFAQHSSGRLYGYGDIFGLYRSDNFGTTWEFLQNRQTDSSSFITGVTVHRLDANRVAFMTGGGLWTSTDGGENWTTRLTDSSKPGRLDRGSKGIAYHPTQADELWLAANRRGYAESLWRSNDNGASWIGIGGTAFVTERVRTIHINPLAPNQIWVGTAAIENVSPVGGLWCSGDSGATWTKVWNNSGLQTTHYGAPEVHSIARNSANVSVIATDNGLWNITATDWNNPATYTATQRAWGGQAPPNVTVLANDTFWATEIGDQTWAPKVSADGITWTDRQITKTADYVTEWSTAAQILAENRVYGRDMIVQDVNDPNRWLCTGGDSVHLSEDNGLTWRYQPGGMPGIASYKVNFDRQNPLRAYIATSDRGIFVVNDGGLSGKTVHCSRKSINELHTYHETMVSADGQTIVGAGVSQSISQTVIIRSTDGGANWSKVTHSGLPASYEGITRAVMSPTDPNDFLVLLGWTDEVGQDSNPGLYRTTNGGANFIKVGGTSFDGINTGSRYHPGNSYLERDGINPNIRYLTLRADNNSAARGLWRSLDGGTNWTRLGNPFGSAWILAFAVDPTLEGRLWAAGNSLRRSDDGGLNWTTVGDFTIIGSLDAYAGRLAVVGRRPGDTYNKTYYSSDNGVSWEEFSSPANRLSWINSVSIDPWRPRQVWLFGPRSVQLVNPPVALDPPLAASPVFLNQQLPTLAATVGQEFDYTIKVSGSPAPTFAITAGSLPAGLTLNSTTGMISGTATAIGSGAITVQASNSAGSASVSINYSATIGARISVSTPAPSHMQVTNTLATAPVTLTNTGDVALAWNAITPAGANNYTQAASTTPGSGITYSWINAVTGGTPISFSNPDNANFGSVPLPFPFRFYGNAYSSLRVCTNGWISFFNTSSSSQPPNSLPNTFSTTPENLIAPFFGNMYLFAGSNVYYKTVDAQTFVISYENIVRSADQSDSNPPRYTFQVILKSDGRILFQYQTIPSLSPGNLLIGIQDITRTLATTITPPSPLANLSGRAYQLTPASGWMTAISPNNSSLAGTTLAPGASITLDATINTTGIATGQTRTGNIIFTSNDSSNPMLAVPFNLNVGSLSQPPVIAPGQSTTASVAEAISYNIQAANVPTSYALTSGSLPLGVILDTTTGFLSGSSTIAGNYTPVFTATNAAGTSVAVAVAITISPSPQLWIDEPFSYPISTNNPDPDAGLNNNNGLPPVNIGGSPSGTSTGLRGTWGTATDVVAGLSYTQGTKKLTTAGGAGRINNATWGGNPFIYGYMTTDPLLPQRIGASNSGNFGVDGSSVFVSLLAQTSSSAANSFNFSFRFDGSSNFWVSNSSTGWRLSNSPAINSVLSLNTPTLLVLRFDFAPGSADTVSLWIDPALGSTLGAADATVSGISFAGIGNFTTAPSVANAMTMDELRIGKSFASVTPFTDTMNAAPPVLNPGQASTGIVGDPLNYQILASFYPTSYTLASGSLPLGVTLNAATGKLSGTPTTAGTFAPSFTATNASGTSAPIAVTMTISSAPPSLATWKFDGDLTATPATYNASSVGTVGYTTGKVGSQALNLIGTANTYAISPTVLNPASTDFTATTWIYVNAQSSDIQGFIQQANGVGLGRSWLYTQGNTSGTGKVYSFFGGVLTGSNATLPINTWTHLALVKSGTTIQIYIDGILNVSNTVPPAESSTGGLIFGANKAGLGNLNGAIDDVRVYSSALNAAQIAAIYAENSPNSLQLFRSIHSLPGNGSQDALTPAGDGVPNLTKYAFNMIGNGTGQAANLTTPNSSVVTPAGNAGLPLIGVESGNEKLQITFIRRKALGSPAPGITYTVQFSEDLITLTEDGSASESATNIDTVFERVTVTESATSPIKRFVRIQITTL